MSIAGEFKSASNYDMRDDASMQAYYDQFKDLHTAADLVAFEVKDKPCKFPYKRHPLGRLTFAHIRKNQFYPEEFMQPREAFFSFMRGVYAITPSNVIWEVVLWTEWVDFVTHDRIGYKGCTRDFLYEIARQPQIRQLALDTNYSQKEQIDDHPFVKGPWINMTNGVLQIQQPPTTDSETELTETIQKDSPPVTTTTMQEEPPKRPNKRPRVVFEDSRQLTVSPTVKMLKSIPEESSISSP